MIHCQNVIDRGERDLLQGCWVRSGFCSWERRYSCFKEGNTVYLQGVSRSVLLAFRSTVRSNLFLVSVTITCSHSCMHKAEWCLLNHVDRISNGRGALSICSHHDMMHILCVR